MRILFVLGTRPEMIKAWSVVDAFKRLAPEVTISLIHTGQHFDHAMSEQIWKELRLQDPDMFLACAGRNLVSTLSDGLSKMSSPDMFRPGDVCMVLGDTASTLIGSLAATFHGIPVLHIESGVRSFDYTMPEEIIRRRVDSTSRVSFAPTRTAMRNLQAEGRGASSVYSGDTLKDAVLAMEQKWRDRMSEADAYDVLVTSHRAGNVDDPEFLSRMVAAFSAISGRVLFPVHPRTKIRLKDAGLSFSDNVDIVNPMGYVDFLAHVRASRVVVTDSGGLQQEAAIMGTPCLTIRDNTEWVETLEAGCNELVGRRMDVLVERCNELLSNDERPVFRDPFESGGGERIARYLLEHYSRIINPQTPISLP